VSEPPAVAGGYLCIDLMFPPDQPPATAGVLTRPLW